MLVFIMLIAAHPAKAEEENTVLTQSGILYPMGYDPNTVGEVQGQVQALNRPENGPVSFQLMEGRERYIVLACPAWYWRDAGVELTEGATVIVRGSKSLGRDQKLYIVAQEIRIVASNQVLVLRKADGTPLWSAQAGKRTGYRGGFGSVFRGGGGQGGPGRGGRRHQ